MSPELQAAYAKRTKARINLSYAKWQHRGQRDAQAAYEKATTRCLALEVAERALADTP